MTEGRSPWTTPETVEGFARSSPNDVLMRHAARERTSGGTTALDIGCGAGRNAVPMTKAGWDVIGTDLSWPMLVAARERHVREGGPGRLALTHGPMEAVPVRDACVDLVVAHGIWNLAESSSRFRQAVAEAARVSKPGAALFVFTFSRNTLPVAATPVEAETFVFTQFAGRPQVFLTADQLVEELTAAGFDPDPAVPLTEYNRPTGLIRSSGPVIYEAAFRRRG